jgi:hypothetical protein
MKLLNLEHRLKPQPEIGDTQVSGEENKLADLERQESTIEPKDHRGIVEAMFISPPCGDLSERCALDQCGCVALASTP